MSFMPIEVPITKPAKPIRAIIMFLKIKNALDDPDVERQRAQVSKKAGNISPSALSVNAPSNDIKSSKFGMATARTTKNCKKKL